MREFWRNVDRRSNPDCWIWIGSRNSGGYGRWARRMAGRIHTFAAHRFAFELAYGPIPTGLHVCHRCDTPSCVNPSHLFVGTADDNRRDMVSKGRERHAAGEVHGRAKITARDVDEIRRLRGIETQRSLAARFGVSQAEIWMVQAGRRWSVGSP
jgi:hypothetical protein